MKKILLLIAVIMVAVMVTDGISHAGKINLPQTGQTTSYATGDDGELQKGVAWPDPRFTDNSDGTVTDNLTGLIWLKNANCMGEKYWADALSISNSIFDGYSTASHGNDCNLTDGSSAGDWRLPDRKELKSLIDYGGSSPALPTGHPFTSVQAYSYWSATSMRSTSTEAWYVNLTYGNVYYSDKLYYYPLYVWPVR